MEVKMLIYVTTSLHDSLLQECSCLEVRSQAVGAEEEEALSPLYAILCTAAVQWLLYSTARCAPVTCGSVLSGCWYSEDVLTEAPTKYQGRHQDGGPEHMPQGHSGGL